MFEEKPQLGEWLKQKQEEPMPRRRPSRRGAAAWLLIRLFFVLGIPVSTVIIYEELAFLIASPPLQTVSGVPIRVDDKFVKDVTSRRTVDVLERHVELDIAGKGGIGFSRRDTEDGFSEFAAAVDANKEITFQYYDVDCVRGTCDAIRASVDGRTLFDEDGRHEFTLAVLPVFWGVGVFLLIAFIGSWTTRRKQRIGS